MEQTGRRESGTSTNAIAAIKVPPRNLDPTRNDGISVAFELVGTPAVFAGMGHLVDRWAGTSPIFALSLAGLALATVVGLVVWRYNNEMAARDAERRETQSRRGYRPARWERSVTADTPEVRSAADRPAESLASEGRAS